MGAVFFKEKLTVYKSTAVILAAASVIVILVHYGQVPGIALILATTFAIYSAIKKTVDQPPVISLLYETIFMAPIMLCVIVWLELHGAGALGVGESYQYFLLLLCGLQQPYLLGYSPMQLREHLCSCSVDGIPQSYIGAYARDFLV